MTPEDSALDKFCHEMDEYIIVTMEENDCDWSTALEIALGENDEYWRALLEESREEFE